MRNFLLLSTMVVIPVTALAASDEVYTNTHTYTPIELTSISQIEKAYKTAAVCFLGDKNCNWSQGFNKGDDYTRGAEVMCREEGYTKTSCTIPEYLFNQCPYSDKYYKECRQDKAKACVDSGYVDTCATGSVSDDSQTCPYDSAYKKCKCDPCSGYDYTYAQATAQGYVADGSCQSCSEVKYKRKENQCSGYSTCSCGGAAGASVCYSGSVQKFDSCKSCCEDTCPTGYSLTSPGGCYDTSTNECGSTCYKSSACCSPCYVDDRYTYDHLPSSQECPGGYKSYTSCNGTCYDCISPKGTCITHKYTTCLCSPQDGWCGIKYKDTTDSYFNGQFIRSTESELYGPTMAAWREDGDDCTEACNYYCEYYREWYASREKEYSCTIPIGYLK